MQCVNSEKYFKVTCHCNPLHHKSSNWPVGLATNKTMNSVCHGRNVRLKLTLATLVIIPNLMVLDKCLGKLVLIKACQLYKDDLLFELIFFCAALHSSQF